MAVDYAGIKNDILGDEVPEKTLDTQLYYGNGVYLKPLSKQERALQKLKEPETIEQIRDFLAYKDNNQAILGYEPAEVLEEFYNDRSWANNNTIGMGADLWDVTGMDLRRKQQYAFIQGIYNDLPYFWNDPNRDFGPWLVDMGQALLMDPLNLITLGVGGQVAKQGFRTLLNQGLNKIAAKQVNKNLIKEIAEDNAKKNLKNAVYKSALLEGSITGLATGTFDVLQQNINKQISPDTEYDLKQTLYATAAGFGFGTTLGAAFGYGSFTFRNKALKNETIQTFSKLKDLGLSEETPGKVLFDAVDKRYLNHTVHIPLERTADESANDYILKLYGDLSQHFNPKYTPDTPGEVAGRTYKPDELEKLPFNIRLFPEEVQPDLARLIERQVATDVDYYNSPNFDRAEVIERLSTKDISNPAKLIEALEGKLGGDEAREIAVNILSLDKLNQFILTAKRDLAIQISRGDITTADFDILSKEAAKLGRISDALVANSKKFKGRIANILQTMGIKKEDIFAEVEELKFKPTDPYMKALAEGDINAQKKYWETVAKFTDYEQMKIALTDIKNYDSLDLWATWVNNALLSSPDTHILNITSGLFQMQWQPIQLYTRGFLMRKVDKELSAKYRREALETWQYSMVYLKEGVQAFANSFKNNRNFLSSSELKYDINVNQRVLEHVIQKIGEKFTSKLPQVVGDKLQAGINVGAKVVNLPLRALQAGDEFIKTTAFKARSASKINSIIMKENPALLENKFGLLGKADPQYKKRFNELMENFFSKEVRNESGQIIQYGGRALSLDKLDFPELPAVDRLTDNDSLVYADRVAFTQRGYRESKINDYGEVEYGKDLTGTTAKIIQGLSGDYKWARILGLHFVNTPGNLTRFVMQHAPLNLGKYQRDMRYMLRKNKDGSYVNPTAAYEAKARMNLGNLTWVAGIGLALMGKTTGGGSRDYRVNEFREKEGLWQPYSYRTSDGFVSLNRLDPLFTPFMIAADIVQIIQDFEMEGVGLNEETVDKLMEAGMGVFMSLYRNFTSKFYTKGIVDIIDTFLGPGLALSYSPERKLASVAAQFTQKAVPLSGFLRYADRVTVDHTQQLWGYVDQLRRLTPGTAAVDAKLDSFGTPVPRPKGRMILPVGGLGFATLPVDLPSTPFAYTKFKDTVTNRYFEESGFTINAPVFSDRKSDLDLRYIKNEKGQSAYNYMWQESGKIKLYQRDVGRQMTLREYVEWSITNPRSEFNKLYAGEGEGGQFEYLRSVYNKYRREARDKVIKENIFPEIRQGRIDKQLEIKRKKKEARETQLQRLIQGE